MVNKPQEMKSGYYWAIIYGETMVVQVYNEPYELVIKTFEYGYVDADFVEFISKEPITI